MLLKFKIILLITKFNVDVKKLCLFAIKKYLPVYNEKSTIGKNFHYGNSSGK